MGFQKNVEIDTDQLLSAVAEIFESADTENEVPAAAGWMQAAGWKSPTEIRAHKRQFIDLLAATRLGVARQDGTADIARARIILKVMEVFDIDLVSTEPTVSTPAYAEQGA